MKKTHIMQPALLRSDKKKVKKNDPYSFGTDMAMSESSDFDMENKKRKLQADYQGVSNEENETKSEVASQIRKLNDKLKDKAKKKIKGKMKKSFYETLEKGGPGSGKKGHKTNRDNVIQLKNKLNGETQDQQEQLQTRAQHHLKQLEGGAVLENFKLKSEKPVLLNMEQATAQGYTPEDHRDAANIHYELADKLSKFMEKHKAAGVEIPPEISKISKFHMKKMKEHMKAGLKIEERRDKAGIKEMTKKSTTQMAHHESPDIDTAEFAVSLESAQNSKWLERLYRLMDGYEYADEPRSITLDKGMLTLAKVGEGEYTGFFTKVKPVEGGELVDNEKMRIERITIPDLVQLLMAKEFISPLEEMDQPEEEAEMPIPPEAVEVLNAKLQEVEDLATSVVEQGIDTERMLDKRIHLMELVNKLLT